jgi:hypothetical protein
VYKGFGSQKFILPLLNDKCIQTANILSIDGSRRSIEKGNFSIVKFFGTLGGTDFFLGWIRLDY